jgi:hypothetical protein
VHRFLFRSVKSLAAFSVHKLLMNSGHIQFLVNLSNNRDHFFSFMVTDNFISEGISLNNIIYLFFNPEDHGSTHNGRVVNFRSYKIFFLSHFWSNKSFSFRGDVGKSASSDLVGAGTFSEDPTIDTGVSAGGISFVSG